MIAAWMLYTIAVSLLLFLAAGAAEYVGRALSTPTRFVWLLAMIAATGLSARAFALGRQAPSWRATDATGQATSLSTDVPDAGDPGVESATLPRDPFARLLETGYTTANRVAGVAQGIDVAALEGWNRPLAGLWIVSSLCSCLWFAAALLRLRRLERSLTPMSIGEHRVLLSDHVGPAVLGIVRPRIVVPRWVVDLPEEKRHLILAHEREHATTSDPAMMYAAALLLAIQPWNLVLWPLFARLRLALESDCDRRVLGTGGDVHRYGRLLVDVHERMTSGLSPLVTFAAPRSHLERRIRRIASRPRLLSAAAGTAMLATALLVTVACTAASPVRGAITASTSSTTSTTPRVVPGVSVAVPAQWGTLEGNWRVSDYRVRVDSAPAVDASQLAGTMAFLGNTVTMAGRAAGMENSDKTYAFTLDTVASPHRIRLSGDAGFTWTGIYQITGDSLRVALPVEHWTDRPEPPADFGAPNTITWVLSRERR